MAHKSCLILEENQLKIKLVCRLAFPHCEVGKSQVDQANKVHHGKDYGASRGVFPDELVEQQADGADDNQDKGGGFQEVSHSLTLIIAYFSMLSFPTLPPSQHWRLIP